MKSMHTTAAFGGWCSLLCVMVAMAQTSDPAAVLNVTSPGVAVADTNVLVPATSPIAVVTNQPVVSPQPAASIVSTGVTHKADIPAFPVVETLEAHPATVGCGFCTYQATGSMFKVGTRSLNISLKETTRGSKVDGEYIDTFMGSIMKIEGDDSRSLDRFFAQVRPLPVPVWFGITRDHVGARTVDYDGRGVEQTDGSVKLSGWMPYLQVAWPNRTRFTPYVEAGRVNYDVEFTESKGWSDGGNRFVEVGGSAKGSEYAAGATIRLWKHLSVDFYMRKMSIDDVTGDWYYGGGLWGGEVIFPLSYTAYGFGVVGEF